MSAQTDDEEETKRIRRLLGHYRKEFIKDLEVGHVVPELLQELILAYEDKQLIDGEITSRGKSTKLLEILLEKSEGNAKALPAFKLALQQRYKWLHDKLTEDVPDHEIVMNQMKPEIHSGVHNSNGHEFNKLPKESVVKLGWVQSLPPINIERPELLDSVTEKVLGLKANHYLVIHGMAGSGKTVLATQVIRNILRDHQQQQHRSLEGEVHWLSIGKDTGDTNETLIDKMRILCEKLNVNRAPESVDHGKEILRDALVTRPPVLLVLDNVWSGKVVKAFDVGFRTIVTTRDATVMDVINGRLSYKIPVLDGFTESESLDFFCEALNVPNVQDLPSQARLIHRECKGSPMVISLIASLLQDHQASGVKDVTRWEYYYESLSKKKYSSLRRDRFYEHASISDAISLSFESLSEKEKRFYQDFALFQHDVSVPCKVLETMWDVTKWKVEDIMKNFVRKSLAVEEYDDDKNMYKYLVHDLQLDYLKGHLDPDMEKVLHGKLVKKYEDKCNSEFHKLQNDCYIHFHIGYHLYKAGRTDLFSSIYLDLNFVGEKLKITGPADLLLDFRKYRSFITRGIPEDEKYLEELEELTNQVGYRLYGHSDIDIMQVGIQSPHLESVHKIAKDYGRRTSNRLYLEWKNTSSCQGKSPEITVACGDYVRCAKFVGCEGHLFIAGLSSGEIKLCDLESSAVHCIFRGHTEAISSLSVYCPQYGPKTMDTSSHVFASGSDDRSCRLWELGDILVNIEGRTNGAYDRSPSPKTHYRPFVFDKCKLNFGYHSSSVTSVSFSVDGHRLVSASSNEILIWKIDGTILQKISTSEDQICHSCVFPPIENPKFVLGLNVEKIWVFSTNRPALRIHVTGHYMKIVELIFRSSDCFCTVSENEVALWKVSVCPIPPVRKTKPPVSPSISVPFTNGSNDHYGDDEVSNKSSYHSNENLLTVTRPDLLFPPDFNSGTKRSSRASDDCGASYILRSGRSSPSCGVTTEGYSGVGSGTTYLDTPDSGRIRISRGRFLTKKSRGFFTCAALDKKVGELLACGTYDQKIALFQLDKWQYLGEFSAHFGSVTTLCFSPVDEFTLLSGSGDKTVKVWDLKDEENEKTEPQKTGIFSSVCIQANHFISVCATERRTIQIYKDACVLGETDPADDSITAIGILKDGTHAVAGTIKGHVLWVKNVSMVVGGAQLTTEIPLEVIGNHEGEVTLVEFGSDGKILASASYDRVLIFKDFEPHRVIRSTVFNVIALHFCFLDTAVVVCNEEGLIQVHKVIGKGSSDWKTPIRISCSLMVGGRLFVGTVEDGIYALSLHEEDYSIKTEQILDCKHQSAVRSLAVTSDGDKLAVGHENGLIAIWNISKAPWSEETDLIHHKSRARFLKFSSKGEAPWLLSCGDQVALWTLDKPVDKVKKSTFMEERRRRKSGESPKTSNRLSLEIPADQKLGRQGKRELLQTFMLKGNFTQYVASDSAFTRFITVDNFGVFYELEVLSSQVLRQD